MHRDVIQIIKHNGDNDAFPKPWQPPLTRLQLAQRSQPALLPNFPFLEEPRVPQLIFLGGRARAAELLGWIVSFPRALATALSFYLFIFISGGSRLVTACSASTFYHTPRWCRAPCLKAFQGKRVRDFHAFSSSGLSQSWVIIHSCRRVRDDAPLTFHRPPHNQTPPTALLMQILGRKDCRSLTSAVFSLSRSPVRHISAAKKISRQNHGAFAPPHLQTLRWERQTWSGGQDGNVHRGTCGLGFYRRTAQRGCNFLRVIDESLGWLVLRRHGVKTRRGVKEWKILYMSQNVPKKSCCALTFCLFVC